MPQLPSSPRSPPAEAHALLKIYRALPRGACKTTWLIERFKSRCIETRVPSYEKRERRKELDATLTVIVILQLQNKDEIRKFWQGIEDMGAGDWVRHSVIRTAYFLNLMT